MRSLTIRLTIALITFLVGVGAAAAWLARNYRSPVTVETPVVEQLPAPPVAPRDAVEAQTADGESPDAKAVRLAEEFIARNGYTDLPPDRDNLSYETIEWGDGVEEILRLRHDTLERKAYGLRRMGRMGGPGWVIVFRHRGGDDSSVKTGRAVTMDKNFQNLRVEHKDFFLAGVDRKL